jgi:ribosomal protein S18 acetylase RimI-like enzyme
MRKAQSLARKRYRVTFEPLRDEAKVFLSWATNIDFTGQDFSDEDIWFCCTVYDAEIPIIVIIFEFKAPHDAHFTLAVADPRGLSRQLITTLYRTVFKRADRVTALVEPDNKIALNQVWRMGFRYEGYLRRGYGDGKDAVVFGLLPEECPYMMGGPFTVRVVEPTHDPVARMQ